MLVWVILLQHLFHAIPISLEAAAFKISAFHDSPDSLLLLDTIHRAVQGAFTFEGTKPVGLRVLKRDREGVKAKLVDIVENNLDTVTTV